MGIKILYLTEAKITIRLRNVLKVEIGEIRVIAPLFIEFLLSNLRFKSQSDVILFFLPFMLRRINVKIEITLPNLFLANPSTNEGWLWKRISK